jgi:2-oxoglutarate dehydrogenase complex dehydrogenase (E1) component-like enzyme
MQVYMKTNLALHYAGRPAYAAPAEGSMSKHQAAQAALITAALGEAGKIQKSSNVRIA